MKRYAILPIALCHFFAVVAQETTYSRKENDLLDKKGGLGSLVIIPFEKKMYMSDADASIGREMGLQPGEIVVKFRNALVAALETELSRDWDIRVFHEATSREAGLDLEFVHGSVRYNFVPVSEEVLIANDTTLRKKDARHSQRKTKGTSGMKEGQLITVSDHVEKFMDVEIASDTLFRFLENRIASGHYLFINEFDIRYDVTDPDNIAGGGLRYRLKVHFSCLDKSGQTAIAGAATTSVASDGNNLYEIIADAIPVITEKVAFMIRKRRNEKKG